MKKYILLILWVILVRTSSLFSCDVLGDLNNYRSLTSRSPGLFLNDFLALGMSMSNRLPNSTPLEGGNDVHVAVLKLATKNVFNLENYFVTHPLLSVMGTPQESDYDVFYAMNGVPKLDTVTVYYFFKSSPNRRPVVRLELPCINRVGKNKTRHNELERCLRQSALYTQTSGSDCLLINSFSRAHKHQGVLDPVHGAIDLLLASQMMAQHRPHLEQSYFGTSWGGIGVYLSNIVLYPKAILGHSGQTAKTYFTANFLPVYQYFYPAVYHYGASVFVNYHGDADKICDYGMTKAYGDKNNILTMTIPGAKHNFHMFDHREGEKINPCQPLSDAAVCFQEPPRSNDFITDFQEFLRTSDSYQKKSSEEKKGQSEPDFLSMPSLNTPILKFAKTPELPRLTWAQMIQSFGRIRSQDFAYGSTEDSHTTALVMITHTLRIENHFCHSIWGTPINGNERALILDAIHLKDLELAKFTPQERDVF